MSAPALGLLHGPPQFWSIVHGPAEFWPIVCATGHRPHHLDKPARAWIRPKLRTAARWLRDERGTTVGISGLALGVDLWWAEAVLEAGLTLGAHIPCLQQPDRWPLRSPHWKLWQELWAARDPAHSHVYADEYTHQAPHLRNAGMLAASSAVLCAWCPNRTEGSGTFGAVRIAVRKKMRAVHLDPCRQTVRLGRPDTSGRAAWEHHCTSESTRRAGRGSARTPQGSTASSRMTPATSR